MTWIDFIPFAAATGRLRRLYDRYKRANDTVGNIIAAHSLRPHILEGHMALYRAVLGHSANTTPLWFLEAVGVHVSALNGCAYCVEHHCHYGRLAYPGDLSEWQKLEDALTGDRTVDAFSGKQQALLDYAKMLTLNPKGVAANTIRDLRAAGADDGEILETNQVAGYFAYVNRAVLGLGVTLDGEVWPD